jgi:hypothetical protein
MYTVSIWHDITNGLLITARKRKDWTVPIGIPHDNLLYTERCFRQMWLFTQLNTHIRAVTESISNVTVHQLNTHIWAVTESISNVTVHTVEHTHLGSHRKYIKCDCAHSWTHTSVQSHKVYQTWLFTQLNTHLGSHRKYIKCVSNSYHCHNLLWTIPHALRAI